MITPTTPTPSAPLIRAAGLWPPAELAALTAMSLARALACLDRDGLQAQAAAVALEGGHSLTTVLMGWVAAGALPFARAVEALP